MQISFLVVWYTMLPTLPWWIALLPGLIMAAWLSFRLASLAGVIIYDYRNKTHTPFFK